MVYARTIIWQTLLVTALTGLLGGSGWLQALGTPTDDAVRPWQMVTSTSPSATTNQLLGVVALSADNVWAVGHSSTPVQALIEHFDGRSWRLVATPSVPGATGHSLQAGRAWCRATCGPWGSLAPGFLR